MISLLTITVALPTRALSPNGRVSWGPRHVARKAQRFEAATMAMKALRDMGIFNRPEWKKASIRYRSFHRVNAKHDPDNLIASMKGALDGLVDAGVLANDNEIQMITPLSTTHDKNPRVEIDVVPL